MVLISWISSYWREYEHSGNAFTHSIDFVDSVSIVHGTLQVIKVSHAWDTPCVLENMKVAESVHQLFLGSAQKTCSGKEGYQDV